MGPGPVIQLAVPVGLRPVLEHPVLGETPLDAGYARLGHVQGLGRLGSGPALAGLQQDAGLGRDPSLTPPDPDHMLQLVAFLRRQLNRKLLPDHTTTSQQHLLPAD